MRGREAREQKLLSDEHFTVDGTLIEAWASLKSFRRKDKPPCEAGLTTKAWWISVASAVAMTRTNPPLTRRPSS